MSILIEHPGLDVSDVAYSLATTRTHHPHRAAVTVPADSADPRRDLLDALGALGADRLHPGTSRQHVAGRAGKTVFVLPGQGAQYPGMGAQLYDRHPVFAATLDDVCAALDPHLDVALRDVMFAAPGTDLAALLQQTAYAQPALFAWGVALHAVLAAAGITADYLMGHSIGELTAAHLAGVLCLTEAAHLVAARGRLMQTCTSGAMMAITASEHDVTALLTDHPNTTIAAINSPTSVVVSGPSDELDRIGEQCAARQYKTTLLSVSHAFHSALMDPVLPEFAAVAAGLTFHAPSVPILSNLTGTIATPDQLTCGEYWTRHLREPVRFHDGIIELLTHGAHRFVELSPHPVLAPAITDTLTGSADSDHFVVIPTMHRDRPPLDTLTVAIAQLHTHGHSPSWPDLYPDTDVVGLPTYPFVHRPYWLAPTPAGEVSAAGLDCPDHPLLGALTYLAGQDQVVLSGRLSTSTQGWLGGHMLHDSVVLPATGFVELVLHAGLHAGCPVIDDLVLHTPLVLSEQSPTDVQIVVESAEHDGRRPFSVRARTGARSTAWVLHASGALSTDSPWSRPSFGAQPARDLQAIDVESFYQGFAELGWSYSPLFRSVRGIGYHPDQPDVVYGEVALPVGTDVNGYGIHPALLDAAMQLVLAALKNVASASDPAAVRLPFAFSRVRLHATQATTVHVELTATGADSFRLHAVDPAGTPVVSIDTLTLRTLPDRLAAAGSRPQDGVLELAWSPLPDTSPPNAAGAPGWVPEWVVVSADPDRLPPHLRTGPTPTELATLTALPDLVVWVLPPALVDVEGDALARMHALSRDTLAQLQGWLTRTDTTGTHLVVLTHQAVATDPDDRAPDLAHAAVWALIHSAQNEHPGRITLIDTDDTAGDALRGVLAIVPGAEPQLAVRHGATHIPRLARTVAPTSRQSPVLLDPDGTVLITGGTGMLGGLFAEHLVTRYGARHLVLVSRRGPGAPGSADLQQRLTELGAHVGITACDAANPTELAAVVASIPPEHRLTGVIHTAGVLDDAVITELTGKQLDTVLAAKADTAWHLHQLTAERDLDAFVLFSSAAGVLGAPGQANYAAANAFLDALAQHRHRRQLPATSLAWGYWQTLSGMAARLGSIERTRLTRGGGFGAITAEDGLDLFDAALTHQRPNLITSPISASALAGLARKSTLPPILSGLTHARPHANNASPDTLAARLAGQTTEQRLRTLTALVADATAVVLAHPDPGALDPERPFKDLGIDSLTALELRNYLGRHTGLSLAATLVFDHPRPAAIATHLAGLLGDTTPAPRALTPMAGRTDEPVAVVGMACRFPGGVDSAAGLWDLVFSGADAVGAFPGDRGWDVAGLFDPDPDAVGKTYTRCGGFVAEAGGFDAEFFGISAREALAMDPQQRLLVEVCWEALETAGIDPATLAGTDTGVFAGAWAQAYGTANSNTAEGFAMTGAATSVASGRVAYVLGLQGPAITVDTACSSSLVATHLACQSLRNGESGLALAGGVTVIATPGVFTEFSRQRVLSPDGRCKAFAAAADGTGWGEGAAVVVLERLSDAHANRHPVLAVIAGSAVNQDGASNGLTAPNGPAQQRVIRQAAANAGVGLDRVDVVEAHGTGTTLGDPVEAGALIATYGAARDRERPLWLGSVKSNIGHTQAAAGAAGIIKMVLALQHGVLPATLHVDAPSPHIDWSAGTVRLLTEPVAWPVNGHPRTAAVSSFGISGTNAHLILQQAPPAPVPVPVAAPADDPPLLGIWPVSARTPTALAAQADRLREHLDDHPDLDLTDLAYSLASTRTHHPYRAAITVGADSTDPRADLLEALAALGADRPHPGVSRRQVSGQSAKTVFVFPGQGGQYPAMGAQLYDRHPGFADAVDQCDAALHPWTGWSVRDVLRGDPAAPPLDRVDVVQPVLFAVMVALAETLAGYGIVPDAVIGHSQGEIAAAHIAGALSLQDAATVVALRGRALARLSGTGAMASVLAGAADLAPRLAPFGQQLSIAAINGPTQTILSGQPAAVARFVADCAREGLQVRSLAVDYASHSPQIDPLRDQLLTELAGLAPAPARIPLYSTVAGASSGDPLDTTTMDAAYWYANLREPVAFHDTIAAMSAAGHHRFVELSPHPVLAAAISDTLAEASRGSAVIATLHRDRPDLDTLASTLAGLHTHGHSPSWGRLYPHANIVGLPTYPFEHRRYWLAPTPAGEVDAAGLGLTRAEHPLLGALTELADQDQVVLSGRLSLTTHPWLTGHHVHDTAVFPGTGFLDLILRAGQCAGCPVIDELVLHTPLVLADTPTDVQITVHPHQAGGRRPFTWHARTSDRVSADWTLHATGVLSDDPTRPAAPGAPAPGVPALDVDDFYARLATHGLSYRDPFRAVHGIGVDPAHPEIIHAEAALPAGTDVTGYGIHPALLDAALHPLAAMLVDRAGEATTPRLPFAFTGVRLHATDATHLQIRLTTIGADTFSLSATDPAGAPVLDIDTVVVRELSGHLGEHTPMTGTHDGVLELAWSPLPQTAPPAGADLADWVVVSGDPEQLPAALRHRPIHTDPAQVDPSRTDAAVWVVPPPPTPDADPLRRIHTLTRDAVTQLQQWLSRTDTTDTRLVVLTRHAVSVSVHDRAPDLAHAALWALIHAAHNEHPDRITLLDTDDTSTTGEALPGVLAIAARLAGEPQLAVRRGAIHIPRLARTVAPTSPQSPMPLDPDGTVLITGGTGMLGGLFAEHLVTRYGARHLVLLSRRGTGAPGAADLQQRLTELGAHVSISACDAANPTELAAVVAAIPPEHRLTAVIHTAGVLDDAVISQLNRERLDAVLAAKADAAWHLHQVTAERDLDAFVLFSSAAGVVGTPGQANYAAANAVLDALAHHRHRRQLPATSLAWGHWQTPSPMTALLSATDNDGLRGGFTPITHRHGPALFDAALTRKRPALITAPVSPSGLARLARQRALPAMLSGLTASLPQAATASSESLAARLAGQTAEQQLHTLTALVTRTAATVLAHPDAGAVDPDRPFKDLGIDSLTALELRNGLAAQTGLSLPATLIFDQPTPAAIAHHLAVLLGGRPKRAPMINPVASRTEEPVAVVGMACRFPGGVDSAAGLWDLVFSGTDAMGAFPGDRGWDVAGLFDPDPDAVGKTYTRCGGFVAEAGGFDAEFFGISAREALAMDPQQRLLVEVCWEALETAGIDPATLAGTDTGVFAGAGAQAYGARGGVASEGAAGSEGYAITGSVISVASGRVAYVLGLQGPAITVDTACSSSLVATHLACQSLRNGESGLALAGGVTVMATPTVFVEFARQRGLAADGRCKAFAAAADGTGWGEGAAVVVLERLSDAHANRHPVLAVIAGSAVNQDGASNGLTAPNGPAQQRVIRQAAANAGVGLDRVDVVEAHGTGTTLGDPVEAGALIATYGAARDRERPLWLGSVKSNIGHTQAAAGAAGIIKMVLALQHGVLPATLHVDAPSPHIDWSAGTVRLLTEPVAWPVNGHPRTAAVSSFGISGTNAHLILQQAPPAPVPVPVAAPADDPPLLGIWPVSARTPTALAAQADRLREHLDDHPDLDLTDLAYSLASTRTHHPYRAAITVGADSTDPRADLLEALAALGADRPHPGVSRRQVSGQSAKTVFVFPGQGGQYPAMGAQLYDRHPGFADAVDQCDAALHPWTGWSVRDVLRGDPAAPPLDRVDVVQPVLFAVMVALAETLAGYGIVPDAVIGHSQGEIAAAHIAGALSLQDAATVVALRGRALARLSGTGAMASVLAGAADLAPRLAPFGQQLSIAAINGPTQTILSGQPAAVARFVADCAREGLQVRSLAVDYASHSPQIDPLRDQLLTELAGLAPAPARIPLYSTVAGASSGDPLDTTTMDAAYWYANLREPVAFHDTIAAMSAAGHHRFVELSPHPVLAAAISDTLAEASRGSAVIATLHRDRPDLDTLASTLAGLHTHGHSPSWGRLYPHANIVGLPTYPFEHRRYWLAPTPAGEVDAAGLGLTRAEHPLLGALTELADQDQVVLSGRLSLTTHPWLTGHHVHDTAVFPGTGFLDLILRAGQCAGCPVIDELVLHTPLVLADTPTDVQITVHPHQAGGRRPFTWHARTSDRVSADWTLHATGVLSDDPTRPAAPGAPAPGVPALDVDDFYARLATHGLSYRDPFRAVHGIGVDPAHPEIIHAEAALPAGTDVTGYGIHPALLDAALHPLAAMLVDRAGEATTPRLPFAFTGVRLHATAPPTCRSA